MTPNKFQRDCVKDIEDLHLTRGDETLMGLMTMNGMAGECIDIYKKVLYQGHPFDREEFAWRLRNIIWGAALCAYSMDYKLEDILKVPKLPFASDVSGSIGTHVITADEIPKHDMRGGGMPHCSYSSTDGGNKKGE